MTRWPQPPRRRGPSAGLVVKAIVMGVGILTMSYGSIVNNVYVVMGGLAVALIGTFKNPQGW